MSGHENTGLDVGEIMGLMLASEPLGLIYLHQSLSWLHAKTGQATQHVGSSVSIS